MITAAGKRSHLCTSGVPAQIRCIKQERRRRWRVACLARRPSHITVRLSSERGERLRAVLGNHITEMVFTLHDLLEKKFMEY